MVYRAVVLFLTIAVLITRPAAAQLTAQETARLVVEGANFLGVSMSLHRDTALLGTLDPVAYAFRFDGTHWWGQSLAVTGARHGFLSVSTENDLALIGAPPDSAHLFRFDGAVWMHEATLHKPHGAEYLERFGAPVSVEKDLALVSAFPYAVYIFRFNGQGWIREAKLEGEGRFGESVALDRERALVSQSPSLGYPSVTDGVHVYRFDGESWVHEATLVAEDPTKPSRVFHGPLALDGDTALLSHKYDDVVYVFRFDGQQWAQVAKLAPEDTGPTDLRNFGTSVSLDGNLALIGASAADDGSGVRAGAAYLFRFDGRHWRQELKLVGDGGAGFGDFVALDDNTALIRSYLRTEGVHVFRIREGR